MVDFVRAFDEHGHPLIHGTDELSAFDVLNDADAYNDWLSYVYAPKGTNRFGYDKMPSSIDAKFNISCLIWRWRGGHVESAPRA